MSRSYSLLNTVLLIIIIVLTNDASASLRKFDISAGTSHTCAIDGFNVICWGANFSGQAQAPYFLNPRYVSAGEYHSCAIGRSPNIKCWGGYLTGDDPTDPPDFEDADVISVGNYHSCAIDYNVQNGLKCWGGSNLYGELDVPENITDPLAVSAGFNSTCALEYTRVQCWGDNFFGVNDVPSLQFTVYTHQTYSAQSVISNSGRHACVIDENGLQCWGSNSNGQTDVPDLVNPFAVSTGGGHTCAIDDNGVHCWGSNDNGQTDVPEGLINPRAISTGNAYNCALDDYGLHCWGRNDFGQSEIPDNLFLDRDGDGVEDKNDAFPKDYSETIDSDKDGIGNNADVDDDNDGTPDTSDDFPLDASEQTDSDSDGIGDNTDKFPLDPTEWSDADDDGIGDNGDNCKNTKNPEQINTDGDENGNVCDDDDDNDGTPDADDPYPLLTPPKLSFTYGPDDKPIVGLSVIQIESDGTRTTLQSDLTGKITLSTSANTFTLEPQVPYNKGEDPITIQDALFVLQHIVELRELNDDQFKVADINSDGKITIQDALKILQHTVELSLLPESLIFLDELTGNPLSEITMNPNENRQIKTIFMGDINQSYTPPYWKQRGLSIDAEERNERNGYSVSASSDGNTIAIGAPFYCWDCGPDVSDNQIGQVRVFNWDGSKWVQKGESIEGEYINTGSLPRYRWGHSVSLSSDGNTFATGSPSVSRGVEVYDWDSSSWTLRGSRINTSENLNNDRIAEGHAVSLSGDGNTLAIGDPKIDGDFDNYSPNNLDITSINIECREMKNGGIVFTLEPCMDSGHVEVYDWNENSWILRQSEILGVAHLGGDRAFFSGSFPSPGQNLGESVSLSNDGKTIAVGAPNYLLSSVELDGVSYELCGESSINIYGSNIGHRCGRVLVYDWDENLEIDNWTTLSKWVLRSPRERLDEEFGGIFGGGYSVKISEDGASVAFISIPKVGELNNGARVYDWDGNDWDQRGDDILSGPLSGLAFTNNGNTLSIARYSEQKSIVSIFDWSGEKWIKRGLDLDVGSDGNTNLSMSDDGKTLVVGLPNLDDFAGQVLIYDWN